jgi:hypothetical protein
MKYLLALFVTGVLSLSLVGCSSSQHKSEQPSPSITVTISPTDESPIDQLAIDVIHEQAPDLINISDFQLIQLIHAACNDFTQGDSFDEALADGMQAGFSAEDTGVLIGVGIGAFCPEYKSFLN